MRKIILFLLLTNLIYSKTYFIASFNTKRLGKEKKNLEKVARVLSNFHLIALQEVMNKRELRRLRRELEYLTGKRWEFHVSNYPVGSRFYKEYYGYLWQRKEMKLEKKIGYYEKKSEFMRPPYGALFKIKDVDFIYVNSHIIFGKSKTQRQSEVLSLSNVYDYFKKYDEEVVIAGDFNLPANDEAFSYLLAHEDRLFYAINPLNKTTIGKGKLASSYDNIFYSLKKFPYYTGRSGYFNFYKSPNFKNGKKEISDHLPVFFEIEIK